MALVMKRKLVCAAAQEDDDGDSDNEMVVKPPSKKQKDVAKPPDKAEAVERTKANDSVTQAPSESRKPKKEKEFAWMDSDEEQGEDEKKDASGSEDKNADVSAATLDSVQTFGRMMVLSPALLKKIPRMLPEDVAAACRALARTKFFDGDINRVLYGVLKRLLLRDRLTVEQADDVLKCFASLNVYDESVFSAIARQMKVRTASIDQALRTQWYDIYKGFNHSGDKDFYQLLALRTQWYDIYKGFNHSGDKDFYQLLEVPHLTAISPAYKRLRCFHNQNGNCAVGDACTYSHDPRAPIELESSFVRPVSKVMMTQTQSNMGRDVYGGPRNGQMNT